MSIINQKISLTILFWGISSLLFNTLTAQIELSPQNCNSLEVSLLAANTSSTALVYSLERRIAPEVWKEYDKRKINGNKEVFQHLEEGVYRAKCILPSGYFAKANNRNSVLVSTAYEIKNCNALSKENRTAIQKISVFPNPTRRKIKVLIPADLLNKKSLQIHLSDLTGKQLMKAPLHSGSTEIELSNLDSGIYLLQLMDGEVAIHIEKLVVL